VPPVALSHHAPCRCIGKVVRTAVRMVDAQDFSVRLAFQRGGPLQRIGHGHQMLALVVLGRDLPE
jgi:hypothetical protein